MAFPGYRFGEFRLDPAGRLLWRGDDEVALHRKAFDCLVYLIERRDRAVERDELLAAVWGDVHLSDSALGQAIFEARRAVDDTGLEQRVIRTMWGFGYRWVAPVELGEPASATPTPAPAPREGPGRRTVWLWTALALCAVGALTGGTAYLSRNDDRARIGETVTGISREGELAVVLPVTVEAEGEQFAWIRLGVMDLIAQRLRAAGQPVVPSDSVIALLRDASADPRADELATLVATTGADLVLSPRADVTGKRWRISLRSRHGPRPALRARGEDEDVLEAARVAADHMAVSLGSTPPPAPTAEPGLATLLQQTRAAVLAQRHDVARTLLEGADPALRAQPELGLQMAYVELHSHHVHAAREILESLLPALSAERDAELRARVLHHLGWVHKYRADPEAAVVVLQEAANVLTRLDQPPPLLGRIQSTLGTVALHRGDADKAQLHFARARVLLQGTGDALGLAALDNHMGLLAIRRERYAEALSYFESAARQAAAMHDLGNELGNLANIVWVCLGLLDPQGALAVEPRLNELLTRADDPLVAATGKLARVLLLDARGRTGEAASLLDEVLRATDSEDLLSLRVEALRQRAEHAARMGDLPRAMRLATEAVELAPPAFAATATERGHAWLISVRAHLAAAELAVAAVAAAELHDWARRQEALPPKIDAALAQAELAAAEDRRGDAEAAFQRALALADGSSVPLRSLRVAESYVPWLLAVGPRGVPDPERALAVANRVARYADRHYDAALLQLRVTHAVGAPPAWRMALANARALAGPREIPSPLRTAPRARRAVSPG